MDLIAIGDEAFNSLQDSTPSTFPWTLPYEFAYVGRHVRHIAAGVNIVETR